MRTTATNLVSVTILIVLLNIRLALYFTDYSITSDITDYLVNTLILGLLSFLFIQTSLPKRLKIFVLISILTLVGARIGLNFFMSVFGERTLQKLGTWKVEEYNVVKQLNVGWATPPYEAYFVTEEKLSGLIIKTFPVQQIDSCTFKHNKKDRNILIDICNKKVVEVPDEISP